MKEKIVTKLFWEDSIIISPRITIFKDSEMSGILKDGRKVWFNAEKDIWYIPERVAKGEVKL